MKRGPTFENYQRMNPSERRFFNQRLTANAVLASIFAGGIFALAIMGNTAQTPDLAQTTPIQSTSASSLREPAAPRVPAELIVPVVDRR